MIGKVFGKLLRSGTTGMVKDIVDAVDNFIETPDEKRAMQKIREQIDFDQLSKQLAINLAEASHRSTFVAGWRPAIGWTCAISLAMFYIPQFALATWLWVRHSLQNNTIAPYPIDESSLMKLVIAMLGFATFRTIEKLTGRAS